MIRTQINLTEEESSAISRLSREMGHSKSELIRQAIDEFIARHDTTDRLKKLRAGIGMWAERQDIPDIRKMRDEFDRAAPRKK